MTCTDCEAMRRRVEEVNEGAVLAGIYGRKLERAHAALDRLRVPRIVVVPEDDEEEEHDRTLTLAGRILWLAEKMPKVEPPKGAGHG